MRRAVTAHIVHPSEVNQLLLRMDSTRGTQVWRFVQIMERAENWAIDEIHTDSEGNPIGVNDDRGTAEERLRGVMRLEEVLNSPAFAVCIRDMRAGEEVCERLIEVMAMLKASRFIVCLNHLSRLSPQFVSHWLLIIDQKAEQGHALAHVLRERLQMLRRANLVRSIFSYEASKQVLKILEGMKS